MKRIKDLRTRGVGTHRIQQGAPVEEAAGEFVAKNVSALVVYDGEKLAGIFTKNDLIGCVCGHPDGIRGLKVGDFMQANVFTTTVDANLDNVKKIMLEKGFHHVPVLDGDEVVGMVTLVDILVHQKSHLGSERDELMRYIQGS